MLRTVIRPATAYYGGAADGRGSQGGGTALTEDFSEGMEVKRIHLEGAGAHQVKDGNVDKGVL